MFSIPGISRIFSEEKSCMYYWRTVQAETLYPKCLDDLVEILAQARDNNTQVRFSSKFKENVSPVSPHPTTLTGIENKP